MHNLHYHNYNMALSLHFFSHYRHIHHICSRSIKILSRLLLTQVGTVVFELLGELLCVGGLGRDHLPLSGFLQHGSVPIVGADCTDQNPVLYGGGVVVHCYTSNCGVVENDPVALHVPARW